MTIAVIRIKGQVKVRKDFDETLYRLRLRRKYACIFMKDSEENKKFLNRIRSFVAYGKISEDVLKKVIQSRGEAVPGKKLNVETAIKEVHSGNYETVKPYFRLQPPRGGIKSKLHFPKGVLGDHGEEMNKLLERMI